MKHLSYTDLIEAIQKAPDTWLPGLLITAANETIHRGKIFKHNGASTLIRKLEDDYDKSLTSITKPNP